METRKGLLQNIFYRHFDLPTNFPVIGLLGDSWKSTHAPITRLHFHNCLEIGYLYQGSGELYLADQRIPFKAPCIVLSPPNVPHYYYVDVGVINGAKWIYVDPVEMASGLNPRLTSKISEYQRTLNGSACVLSAEEYSNIFTTLETIISEMETPQPHYKHVVRELLSALFLMLIRTTYDSAESDAYVVSQLGSLAPAITYIVENYMNDISIDHLAQLCHVSTSHFRRIFKKILGWTPLDYIQVMRIDRACALLYNCDYSITEVSLQVGYPSPSSFNRQFHRIHGISPSQWRLKMRSEENPLVTAYFDSLPPATSQFFPQNFHEKDS